MKKIFILVCLSILFIMVDRDSAYASSYLLQIEEPDPTYTGVKVTLTAENRKLLEELVQGEAGGEGYIGCALVAQCIRDHLIRDKHTDIKRVREDHKFEAEFGKTPNEDVKKAVKFIFDDAGSAVQHRVLYFYAPKVYFKSTRGKNVEDSGTYPFHENATRAEYLLTYKGQKFYDELATSATKDYKTLRKGYNIIIYSNSRAWDKLANIELAKDNILGEFDYALVNSNTSNTNSYEGLSMSLADLLWGDSIATGLGNYLYVSTGLEGLSIDERMQIETFQRDIHSVDNPLVYYTRVGFLLAGILFLVYSVILFMSYWFDRYNVFIEVSMLRLVSFNRYMRSPDEENITNQKINGVRVVTLKSMIIIFIRNVLIGVLVISGSLFGSISFIVKFFYK